MKMKKTFLFITILSLFAAIVFVSCSSGDDSNDLPYLSDNDDVCTAMDDMTFMKWCYENYDANGDGKVSKVEAAAVREFVPGKTKLFSSVKGIEYFTGVEKLDIRGSFPEVELRFMTKLNDVRIESKIKEIDLSNNNQLQKISLANVEEFFNISVSNDYTKVLPTIVILNIEKMSTMQISLYGSFLFDYLDISNTNISYIGIILIKNYCCPIKIGID